MQREEREAVTGCDLNGFVQETYVRVSIDCCMEVAWVTWIVWE
jgi:hypothetical protein